MERRLYNACVTCCMCAACMSDARQSGPYGRRINLIDRRHFGILTVAIVTAWTISAQLATAQSWPMRPVTMVVPFRAGSASDTEG